MVWHSFFFILLWIITIISTASKVNFISSPFLTPLSNEVPLDSIPVCLGGNYHGWNSPFEFDQSEDGLLAFPHRSYPFHTAKESSTTVETSVSNEESKGNETQTNSVVSEETNENVTTPEEVHLQSNTESST